MAAGITIVELPCTAGFPVLWGNIITSNKISVTLYLLLLVLYLLTYLLDEILLVGISLITLNAFKINQKKGENLKLISGIVITGLSIILLFLPETLNEFGNMVKFFIICICISCFIILQKKFTTYIKQFKFKQ